MSIYLVSGKTAHYPSEILGYFEDKWDAISFAENNGCYSSFDVEEIEVIPRKIKVEPNNINPGKLDKCELHEFRDGSLCLACGTGMESDLVFASGCMAGDPGLVRQREILEIIVAAIYEACAVKLG